MESIRVLNKRLEDRFGRFHTTSSPLWRLSWSEHEYEKRYGTYRDFVSGTNILLREVSEVRETKKYPYIENRWILERLVEVPEINQDELTTKLSYECIWAFKLAQQPTWNAIEFLVDVCQEGTNKHKTIDKGPGPEEAIEERRTRIEKLHEELFGDESEIADALHWGQGVIVPGKFGDEEI